MKGCKEFTHEALIGLRKMLEITTLSSAATFTILLPQWEAFLPMRWAFMIWVVTLLNGAKTGMRAQKRIMLCAVRHGLSIRLLPYCLLPGVLEFLKAEMSRLVFELY